MQIAVRPDADTPIYQQIVDAIYSKIKSGELAAGEKLPTVRDLAEQMKLARGTIKRAYDELEKLELIQMTQGRGTFVLGRKEAPNSHKERAMEAIDELLDELEGLSFSPREVQIFFDLKLRERLERGSTVRIAVVDCNPESLAIIASQLDRVEGIDVYPFLLEDVLKAPYKLGGNMDLIVTTNRHFTDLEQAVTDVSKVARIVLTPTQNTVMELAKLREDQRMGIMCASEAFAHVIRKGCAALSGRERPMEVWLFGSKGHLSAFLEDKDVLFIPPGYMSFCTPQEGEAIRFFGRRGAAIQYEYQIDAGSFMYLRDLIECAQRQRRNEGR